MDLAIGAKRTWVMMEHVTKDGQHKLVSGCTYPLTGMACVSRIYADIAVIDVTAEGFVAIEIVPGLELSELAALTGAPIADGRNRKAA
jgi:3-oxoadipate CoA-transferase, beta subunit